MVCLFYFLKNYSIAHVDRLDFLRLVRLGLVIRYQLLTLALSADLALVTTIQSYIDCVGRPGCH